MPVEGDEAAAAGEGDERGAAVGAAEGDVGDVAVGSGWCTDREPSGHTSVRPPLVSVATTTRPDSVTARLSKRW